MILGKGGAPWERKLQEPGTEYSGSLVTVWIRTLCMKN